MGHATTRRRDIDRARVREAVEHAERRTSSEIVVAVAPFFIGRMWPAARRAFVRLGVAATSRRNGVLVFVVPARRQVVVLPDEAAAARVDPSTWSEVASLIAEAFGRGEGTSGLVDGIDRLARTLSGPFPRTQLDVNELPDEPVLPAQLR
jgi:uncharacterized membrane protein